MSTQGVSEKDSLRRRRPIPKQKLLAKFINYFVKRPRRSKQISVAGVESFYGPFAAAYQRVTDTRFNGADTVKVNKVQYIIPISLNID